MPYRITISKQRPCGKHKAEADFNVADSEVATGEALWRMWKVVNGKINQSMGEPCRGCVEESGILLPKLGGNGLIH